MRPASWSRPKMFCFQWHLIHGSGLPMLAAWCWRLKTPIPCVIHPWHAGFGFDRHTEPSCEVACRPLCGDSLRLEGEARLVFLAVLCSITKFCRCFAGWRKDKKATGQTKAQASGIQAHSIFGTSAAPDLQACDDGNLQLEDGCDSSCQVEAVLLL